MSAVIIPMAKYRKTPVQLPAIIPPAAEEGVIVVGFTPIGLATLCLVVGLVATLAFCTPVGQRM